MREVCIGRSVAQWLWRGVALADCRGRHGHYPTNGGADSPRTSRTGWQETRGPRSPTISGLRCPRRTPLRSGGPTSTRPRRVPPPRRAGHLHRTPHRQAGRRL